MALFEKLKSGLAKTRTGVVGRLQNILSFKSQIDENLLEDIEELLISSDIGVDTALSLIEMVRLHIRREHISDPAKLKDIICDELKRMLDSNPEQKSFELDFFSNQIKPYVILIAGVNGTGKTTTIGKLAARFTGNGKKVLIAAADTFRAAAGEQLEIWAERSNSQIVRQRSGADPAAVAFDAMNAALARDIDVVIIDTAGRLHTKINLMEELKKIKRVLAKKVENAPHHTFLVLDATVGQNAKRQVEEFNRIVDLSGIILTKLDGTAKGGVVISIVNEFDIPVRFIGIGEKIDDLEIFNTQSFVDAIFQS